MKTDFTNAFNSFKRSAALEDLIKHIPKLGSIVCKFYGVPNTLLYDNMDPITVNMGWALNKVVLWAPFYFVLLSSPY